VKKKDAGSNDVKFNKNRVILSMMASTMSQKGDENCVEAIS
jgi:hypothetical protein